MIGVEQDRGDTTPPIFEQQPPPSRRSCGRCRCRARRCARVVRGPLKPSSSTSAGFQPSPKLGDWVCEALTEILEKESEAAKAGERRSTQRAV